MCLYPITQDSDSIASSLIFEMLLIFLHPPLQLKNIDCNSGFFYSSKYDKCFYRLSSNILLLGEKSVWIQIAHLYDGIE